MEMDYLCLPEVFGHHIDPQAVIRDFAKHPDRVQLLPL